MHALMMFKDWHITAADFDWSRKRGNRDNIAGSGLLSSLPSWFE